MRSELVVESFYAYIPESHASGHTLARRSQRLTYSIKDGARFHVVGRGWTSAYTLAAERVAADLPLGFSLRAARTLVPVPGSLMPPPVPGPHHSVSREIARALVTGGMGTQVGDLFVRRKSILKASRGGPRDAHLHRESLDVVAGAPPPQEPVVLVDDVTTTGAQMLGAALRLLDAFPGLSQVTAFALIRTTSEEGFEGLHDPARRVTRLASDGSGSCTFFELPA